MEQRALTRAQDLTSTQKEASPLSIATVHIIRALAVLATVIASMLPASAARWTVVPAESRISFSGTHAGKPFKGSFGRWQGDIVFDPADLATSMAKVTIALDSARTGDGTYDKTLPSSDWFNVAKGNEGVFETSGFRSLGENNYAAEGSLTIRGFKVPVTLSFEWTASGDKAKLIGRAELRRLDFGIGKASDAAGEWVSLTIPIEVAVSLAKG